jgi:hypothetical protein
MKTFTRTTAAFLAIAMTGAVLAATVSTAEAGPRNLSGSKSVSGLDLGSSR